MATAKRAVVSGTISILVPAMPEEAITRMIVKNFAVKSLLFTLLMVLPLSAQIHFVQQNYTTSNPSSSSVVVAYPVAQTAGNLNIVAVGWNDTSASVRSVTDSL